MFTTGAGTRGSKCGTRSWRRSAIGAKGGSRSDRPLHNVVVAPASPAHLSEVAVSQTDARLPRHVTTLVGEPNAWEPT
jgi:hypothetical protein